MTAKTSSPNWMQRTGASPGKIILIGVLGVVFLVVVISQFGGDSNPAAELAKTNAPEANTPDANAPDAQKSKTRVTPVKTANRRAGKRNAKPAANQKASPQKERWPTLALSDVISDNPFALPSIYKDESENERDDNREADDRRPGGKSEKATRPTELKTKFTSFVVIGAAGRYARIGAETITVGDTIDGFEVVDITSRGVVLASPQHP